MNPIIPALPQAPGSIASPPSRPIDRRAETLAGGPGFGSVPPLGSVAILEARRAEGARRYGPRVFEWMMRHPYVAGPIDVLIYTTLANQAQILPAIRPAPGHTVESVHKLSQECADLCIYCLDRLQRPLAVVMRELLITAFQDGCSLAEDVWVIPEEGEHEGELILSAVKPKSREAWRFVVDSGMNVKGVLSTSPGPLGWRMLPAEKFTWLTWGGVGGDPRGMSLLDRVAEAWNFLSQLPLQHFRHIQRFGQPLLYGKIGKDSVARPVLDEDGLPTSREVRPERQMLGTLEGLRAGWVAVFGEDDEVELLEAKGDGRAFELAEGMKRAEIAVGILLQARQTIEAEHNSKDVGTAEDVAGNVIRFLRDFAAGAVRQLCHKIICNNKGRAVANLHTPIVEYGDVEHHDVAEMISALGLVGYRLDPDQFAAIDARLGGPISTRSTSASGVDDDVPRAADPGTDREQVAGPVALP